MAVTQVRSGSPTLSARSPRALSPLSERGGDDVSQSPVAAQLHTTVGERGFMDVLVQLRFSPTAQLAYMAGVAGASAMLIIESSSGRSWWYHVIEGVLTLLFMSEIGYKISLKGFGTYITLPEHLVELCVCLMCIVLFLWLFFVPADEGQYEAVAEAVLITTRYTVVLARFLFFVRSTAQQQQQGLRRVQLHQHDNFAITLPSSDPHDAGTLSRAGSGAWADGSDDDSEAGLLGPAVPV